MWSPISWLRDDIAAIVPVVNVDGGNPRLGHSSGGLNQQWGDNWLLSGSSAEPAACSQPRYPVNTQAKGPIASFPHVDPLGPLPGLSSCVPNQLAVSPALWSDRLGTQCPYSLARQRSSSTDSCSRTRILSSSVRLLPNAWSASRKPFVWTPDADSPIARMFMQNWYLRSFSRRRSPSVCDICRQSIVRRASTAPAMPVDWIIAATCWFCCARFSDACHSHANSCGRPVGTSVTSCRPFRSSLDPVTSRMNRS